jgi:hypothetical protein
MKNLLAVIIIFIMVVYFERGGDSSVVAADIYRRNWLVDSGLSSFVTATTDASAYSQKTIRNGAVAMARH